MFNLSLILLEFLSSVGNQDSGTIKQIQGESFVAQWVKPPPACETHSAPGCSASSPSPC